MSQVVIFATFLIFLAIFLGVGALAAKRARGTDTDYLLGSRSFSGLFVGLSAGATGNSGFIMVGMVGMAYSLGVSAIWLPIAAFAGEWVFWTFFAERVNRFSIETGTETVPEMLGATCHDQRSRRIIASTVAVLTIVFVGAYAVAQLAAAGKALNAFFGFSPEAGVIIAAVAILSYCVSGGLRASIWTDVVQALIVMAVAYGMLIIALYMSGGMFAAASQLQAVDPELMNLNSNLEGWSFVAYLFGFALLGVGFGLSQPPVLVRVLAGRSPAEVRGAKWIYLGYVYSTWLAMTIFGVLCRVLVPALSDPEQALPFFAAETFHPVLVGIILAGMFSVIASTADSQILACSSALARDLSSRVYAKFHLRFGVRYQQASTLLFGVIAVVATLAVSSSVFTLVLFAVGVLAGSIAPAMIIAIFRRPTNAAALSSAMICGAGVAILWRLLEWNSTLNEAAPAMIAGLIVHEAIMRLAFRTDQEIVAAPFVSSTSSPARERRRVANL